LSRSLWFLCRSALDKATSLSLLLTGYGKDCVTNKGLSKS
jgi:hypothetical protein